MTFYQDAPQRKRINGIPKFDPPPPLSLFDPPLPIDDKRGGAIRRTSSIRPGRASTPACASTQRT
ncbi:MAG: Isochorismatase hydrolase [Candidatus Solibacter sp.]|jgi:hypothetical protein|nr:Isochorismatase hydrolase [Candidatus Solibacter sp.]